MMFPLKPTTRRGDRLTDDEFYAFCQANPSLRIEREEDGQIIFEMPTNTPDFVIKLIRGNRCSDSDEKYTLPNKMDKYIQNGVRLAWVIDPFSQQTIIYRPTEAPEIRFFSEILSEDLTLPGFELRLSNLL